MKLQIWKIYISDGWLGAVHGHTYPIYEGYIPDLELSINQAHHFVHDPEDGENTRYKEHEPGEQLTETPQPEFICEIKLTPEQEEDAIVLADQDSPEERLREIIAGLLKKHNLDASKYKDKELE